MTEKLGPIGEFNILTIIKIIVKLTMSGHLKPMDAMFLMENIIEEYEKEI